MGIWEKFMFLGFFLLSIDTRETLAVRHPVCYLLEMSIEFEFGRWQRKQTALPPPLPPLC